MTPKEKAQELIDDFTFRCEECDFDWNAKRCALIAVDEIIKIWEYSDTQEKWWWGKVKQEIEKQV